MDKVEVWLVRHGETEMNAAGLLSGWTDVALTGLGHRQAAWLRTVLQDELFDGVWSSDLKRARETARLAWGEARTDPRLREIDFGRLEGRRFDALPKDQQRALLEFDSFQAPGGETVEQLAERVLAFLDSLPPGRHLVFTHGGAVRVVLRELHAVRGPDRFLSNGSLAVVDWTRRTLERTRINALGTESALASDNEELTDCSD